jgi:nitrogen fixation/metabolism regulation signal transduction histidine kinase
MQAGHRRQLRNYLLDRQLQLRYTLIMVFISSLLTAGLGYVWYQQMRVTSKSIEVKALGSLTESDVQQIKDEMAQGDSLRLLALVGFGLLFAFAVAGYGIILTHKIAGPLYKITRYMMDVTEGNLSPIYELRKGDQLRDFYNSFKEMHIALRQETEQDVQKLDMMISVIERYLTQTGSQGVGEIGQGLEELRQLRTQKAESLKSRSS